MSPSILQTKKRRKNYRRNTGIKKIKKDISVLKQKTKIEMKRWSEYLNYTNPTTYTPVAQSGAALMAWFNWPKTGPIQGTKATERIGNEIILKSIRMRLHFCRDSSSTATCQLVRVILFRDPALNYFPTGDGGVGKQFGELMFRALGETPGSNSLIGADMLRSKEVIPILDKTILITSSSPTGFIDFQKSYKKGIKVQWTTLVSGTSQISKNGYSMFIVGDSADNRVTFNGQIRFSYYDA